VSGGSVLKGSGGEGAPVGWASCGGEAGEREGERGACLGLARSQRPRLVLAPVDTRRCSV
jgi:hypothetical protein